MKCQLFYAEYCFHSPGGVTVESQTIYCLSPDGGTIVDFFGCTLCLKKRLLFLYFE